MVNNDPNIGRQIGSYRLIALINRGSFGSVYQAQHLIFKGEPLVAIKLLHAALHSQQEQEEFIKEAQVLRMLQHPHILRILDASFQDGFPFLVTEYAAGGSLRDLLLKYNGKPLPLNEAIRILTQVGQALHYAHEQHIVHRDLKPENILFNAEGEVLLADFGIAVILASTRTGRVGRGGTPPYMAPEQFEGLASATSDQYALGCIAYELVTGHRLFDIPNRSIEAYWYHHAKVEPKPATHYQPQLPVHVERAILTALAKDRNKRYSDISAFSEALLKSTREWVEEGSAHSRAKRYEEALAAYDQAIHLDPNDAQVYKRKGDILYDLKRYEEALAAFDQAIRLDPDHAYTYNHKDGILYDLKRYEEALDACNEAIHLDPSNANAYTGKGNILNTFKRYEEALNAYDQAIRLDPNDANAYTGKGNALYGLKHYEEALATYERAIRLDPSLAFVYNNKGSILYDLKRYEEALAAFDQAIRLAPTLAYAYNNKGNALNDLKRYDEAQRAYEKARQLGYTG